MALLDVNADSYFPIGAGPIGGHISAPVFHSATLTGTTALDATYPAICKLDPGGAARDVTLDAEESIPSVGLYRRIVNAADAAENLVVKDDAGSTIGTINQNEQGEFYNAGVQDGTASAWVLIAISAIALS
jgi:hypothetical protein